MPMGSPLTVRSLIGTQGLQKNCKKRWNREGRWMRNCLLIWCSNITMAMVEGMEGCGAGIGVKEECCYYLMAVLKF
jgi:hypothetical protein